ncbi:sulfite exporter TauE/SafE family protein [Pseudoroseomonas globiformis]|uniref:Probable membrane transporter protein n=1 Tax=Teichococcus globiformis TaxID=2307229 RepID=A0ABV7G7H1_9PROT
MESSSITILAVAGVFFVAGMVKGVIGLGLPTVAIGLLGLFLPPAQAAGLLVLPSLLTNFWQAGTGGRVLPLAGKLAPLLLGICAGAGLGTLLGWGLSGGDAAMARRFLGVALVAYGLFGLLGRRMGLPPRMHGALGAASGLVTGLVTAATGVFVMPAVPYLQSLGLERGTLLQGMGLSFAISTLALAAALPTGTLLGGGMLAGSALAILPTLLGMVAGQKLNLPPMAFRILFFAGLLALGAHLALG